MKSSRNFALILGLVLLAAACREPALEPRADLDRLKQAVQEQTEQLYRIHLKLDSAASDITAAELKARSGDCGDAEYHAADAYRNLEEADQELLELGRELQALFNLDMKAGG